MSKITAIAAAALLVVGCKAQQAQNNAAEQVQANAVQPLLAGTAQRVHLIWKDNTKEWKVKLNGGSEEKPKDAKTKFAKDSGPQLFIVEIQDAPPGTTFANPGGLTVWEGNITEPKSQPPSNPTSDQIIGPFIAPNGKMIFVDLNLGTERRVFYSINLSDGTSIDPIIENGGGSW